MSSSQTTANSTGTVSHEEKPSLLNNLRSAIGREPLAWMIIVLDVALLIGFGAVTDGAFLTAPSLQALAINSSQIVLLAIAAAIVLTLGEIDISLGAVLVAASTLSAYVVATLGENAPLWTLITSGVIVGVATGVACAAATAAALLYLRVNSFIASLANLGIFTGVVYVFTNGSNVSGVPLSIQDSFGNALVFDMVPVPAIVAVAMTVLVWFVIRHTRMGVHLISSGSSRDSAVRAGIRVRPLIFGAFIAAGALCGLAGFIDISRFGTTDISGHQTDALAAIAGAVIGGTRLTGGKVSIIGAVAGALLSSIIRTGLIVVGLAPFYQLIAIGLVLLAAVAIGQRRT